MQVLDSSQQTYDDYRELLQLMVLFSTLYCLWPQSYAQRLVDNQAVVLCLCEHLGILTAIQNNSSQLSVERWAFLMPVLHTSWTLCTSPATAPANDIVFLQLAKKYEIINKGISSAVARSFLIMVPHWGASCPWPFDGAVNRNTKRKMDNALKKQGSDKPPKQI